MLHERENISRLECEVKRRKLEHPQGKLAHERGSPVVAIKGNETLFDSNNGTITPLQAGQAGQVEDVEMMDSSLAAGECPCGRFHGPGQGVHDDLNAVGLSDFPLLRGPE